MASWYQTIEHLFVQSERLGWLWLVGVSVLAIFVGEFLRARWRRRLYASAREPRAGMLGHSNRWMIAAVRILALVLIVLALADPRAGSSAVEVKTSKLQIVCLLDRSRSMKARDATPSRFEAGRNIIRDLVDEAGGAAVALVTFAGDARVDVPLTRDYRAVLDRLDEVTPDTNRSAGSNLGAGFAMAATCFAERIESPKILVVITDGETHGVEPELPDDLLPIGTEVLVVGVGDSEEGARIPLRDDDQSRDNEFLIYEGKTVWSKANPELLNRLAEQLRGRFHRIGTNTSGGAIRDLIRRADSTVAEERRLAYRRQAAPLFHWFLLAATGLLCLEMMLPFNRQRRFRSLRPARLDFSKVLMLCILVPMLTISVARADEPQGSPVASQWTNRQLSQLYNRGVEAYRAGRLNDAESAFRTVSRQAEGSLRMKATFNLANSHDAVVNRGGISKREAIRRLEASIDLFRQVIAEGERTEDARANIEIVYRRLRQIQQQPPDSEDDQPSADESPDRDDGAQDEAGDNDKSGDRQPNGGRTGGGESGGDSGPGDSDDPSQGNGSPAGDDAQQPSEPNAEGRSGSGPSDVGRPPDDPTEPLTDQQAEDQLNRIRQRAQDRRRGTENEASADAAPVPAHPGLPW